MARLVLKQDKRVKDVGCLLFALGQLLRKQIELAESNNQLTEQELADIGSIQKQVEELFAEEYFDGPGTVSIEKIDVASADVQLSKAERDQTVIRFHYDGKIGNTNLVNIVVPEIKGPLVEKETAAVVARFQDKLSDLLPQELVTTQTTSTSAQQEAELDLDYYACEALGSIVILSCGS